MATKETRALAQRERELILKNVLKPKIKKTDSLNERARKLKIATDLPHINRDQRRIELKKAVREEGKQ